MRNLHQAMKFVKGWSNVGNTVRQILDDTLKENLEIFEILESIRGEKGSAER